jgi:hypothetical protein
MATLVNPAQTKAIIQRILEAALADTAGNLAARFRELIESPVFEWPGQTIRRSGEVAGSPRNIVDLGNLRDSQRTVKVNAAVFEFIWSVQYAAYVYFGYTTLAGNSYPGRDWVSPVAREALGLFAAEVRKRV